MTEIMIVIVILGVLAAVAVPAFIKYVRRGKTSEAYDKLSMLYRGSVTYIVNSNEDVQRGVTGSGVALNFPPNEGPTPIAGSCCGVPGGQCLTTAADWDTDTWRDLNFQISDPHYYQYTYESGPSGGPGAHFTARANGDLDCDGTYSTFERCGIIASSLSVTGQPGIFRHFPLE
jgi:type IV pilus assembly protein PilA